MQTLITIILVTLAAGYLLRLWSPVLCGSGRGAAAKGTTACTTCSGCSGCA
ncbi:MAG: hypothetical protein KDB84_12550 [Flavobacteriales bacterium]|nr:hypothetical protein [Flavobacteriales bacterium]